MSPDRARSIGEAIAHLQAIDDQSLAPTVARISDFAAANPDALLRTCPEAHLTGSALVVDEKTQRMLILFHRKLQKWLQPGGHADGEGNLASVALREATEETGIAGLAVIEPAIHVDIHEVRPPTEPPHLHLDVRYLVVAPEGSVAVGNHESTALRWVTFDELVELTDEPGLIDLAARGLARLGAR